MPSLSLTTAEAAAQLTRGGSGWVTTYGTPVTVTYGLRATAPGANYGVAGEGAPPNFTRLSLDQMGAVDAALGLWSDVANISFERIGTTPYGSPGYTDAASILVATYDADDGIEGYSYRPGRFGPPDFSGGSAQGDVWLNKAYGDGFAFTPGTYDWLTVVHEIGHAIGLQHPGNYNGGSPTYEDNALYVQDTWQYSIMSYFEGFHTGANYVLPGVGVYLPSTPQLDDIAAAQRIYGANLATRTGDTCYGFFSNADRAVYRLESPDDHRSFTVWDAGGYDLFNFTRYAQDQLINLNAESFSSVGGLTANVAIAAGVTIEAAWGGTGDDTIYGNAASNDLRGGDGDDVLAGLGGDDTLDGGAGYDAAWFEGSFAEHALFRYAGDLYVYDGVEGRGGTDKLVSIERLDFSDGVIDASLLATSSGRVAPAAGSVTLGGGGVTKLAELFSERTLIYGTAVVGYGVHDSWAGGGSLTSASGPIAAGSWTYVPAGEFGALSYTASSAGGTDRLSLFALYSDGTYSNVASLDAVNVNLAPTIRAVGGPTSEFTRPGVSQSLDGLFAWADGPDDAVTGLLVQAANGRIRLGDGSFLADGAWSTLTIAQFRAASYVSATGDGAVWTSAIDSHGGYSAFASVALPGGDAPSTIRTPYRVDASGTFRGEIGFVGDGDVVGVRLGAGVHRFDLGGAGSGAGSLADGYLRLYDGALNLVAGADGGGPGKDAGFTATLATAGLYYLEASSAVPGTGSYVLHVDGAFA